MAKEQPIELEGRVIETKPNLFIVETDNGHRVQATLGGKIKMLFIIVVIGDTV